MYYLEKTIMKEYICNINHCEIRNMIDRVFDTFYWEADGLRQIKMVCARARADNMIMI